MSEKLTSLEEKIKPDYQENEIVEQLNKISYDEFINDKIKNNENSEMEINKEELIKELEEKVINGNDYKETINSYFNDNEKMKIKDLKEKLEPIIEKKEIEKNEKNEEIILEEKKLETIENEKEKVKDIIKNNIKEENKTLETNRKTLEKNSSLEKNRKLEYKKTLEILYPQKKIKTDLDFLSEDLPQDKNREKILSIDYHQNYSLSNRIDTRRKPKFQFFIEKEIMTELNNVKPSNEESVIKPMNAFKEFEKNNNDINNINEIGSSKKEKNLKSYFKNKKTNNNKNKGYMNEDLIDNYINNNNNFNIRNVVYPINQNKKFLQTETNNDTISGIKNIQNKIIDTNFDYNNNNKLKSNNKYNNTDKDNNDYFFTLYKDFSNQNKSLNILDNKILKISQRKKALYKSESPFNSKPNTLIDNMKSSSPKSKNINMQYFEKIGLNQDLYSNKNYNLKDSKDKQKYFDSLKKDLNLFSYNNNNNKQKDNKNSGFKEINEKLEEIKKKKQLNENLYKEKENINKNNNLNKNIENNNQEIVKKKEEEVKINEDENNDINNINNDLKEEVKINEDENNDNNINENNNNDEK